MDNLENKPINNKIDEQELRNPNDKAGFYVRNFLRIYDPESGQVAVETSN